MRLQLASATMLRGGMFSSKPGSRVPMVVWSCAARLYRPESRSLEVISQSPLVVNWSSEKRLGLVTRRLLAVVVTGSPKFCFGQSERAVMAVLEKRAVGIL